MTRASCSEEKKKKLSESNMGKHSIPHTEETKLKISNALTGRKRTEKEIEALKAGMVGRKHKPITEEHRAKLRARPRRAHSEETKAKIKASWDQRRANKS